MSRPMLGMIHVMFVSLMRSFVEIDAKRAKMVMRVECKERIITSTSGVIDVTWNDMMIPISMIVVIAKIVMTMTWPDEQVNGQAASSY